MDAGDDDSLHRFALVLAALPMLFGAVVLAAWWCTQWSWLEVVGLCVIGFGLSAAVFVVVLLGVAWHVGAGKGVPAGLRRRPAAIVLLVLGLNVPAYVGAIHAAAWRFARFTVRLVNEAKTPWVGLAMDGGGVQVSAAVVPAGATTAVELRFAQDGELWLRQPGQEPLLLAGYVTQGMGGAVTVTRGVDGRVVPSSLRGRAAAHRRP